MTKIVGDEVENSMNILHLPAVQGSFGGHVESAKAVFHDPCFQVLGKPRINSRPVAAFGEPMESDEDRESWRGGTN